MLSDDYQGILAENGLTPARTSLQPLLGDDEFAQATIEAASNAKLTPAAANWATVEGTRILEDLFSQIAQGGDVEELASEADERITEELVPDCASVSRTVRHQHGTIASSVVRAARVPPPLRRDAAAPHVTWRATPRLRGALASARPRHDRHQERRIARMARRRTPARRLPLPAGLVLPAAALIALALGYPLVRQVVLSLQEFGLAQQFGRRRSGSGWATTASCSATPTSGPSSCGRSCSASSTPR